MTVVELLEELRRLRVGIGSRDDKLVVDAPSGVITPELAEAIRGNKQALLDLVDSMDGEATGEATELRRTPEEDRLSLTQERLWAIGQLNPDSSQFNLPGGWWLDGPLDRNTLLRAIEAFACHHDLFRRRFVSSDGRPRMTKPDHPGVDLRRLSLGDIGLEEEDTEQLTRWFEAVAAEPFDLERDPLLRVIVLSVSDTRHLLTVVSHSIAWDAWSYDIFLSEVGRNYEALRAGDPLPEPHHQYADFVNWQRRDQERPAARDALQAAITELADYGRHVPLPHVHRSPDRRDHAGARFNFDIPVDLRERLRSFTRERGVTPYMVFLAAYAFLLCRYAGRDRVLLTIPLRGRERKAFETIPGPFTNNLFLPVDVEGHTFSSLLAHVKKETGRAFGGEVPSFERLIEAINQNLADSAFFQLQFSYQNVENRGTHWAEGVRMSAGPVHDSDSAHAEISFWMRDGGGTLDGAIDYRTSLFDEAFIAEFFRRLLALIRAAMASPDTALFDLDLDDPTATGDTLSVSAEKPEPTDTLQALREALARRNEHDIVVEGAVTFTAGELSRALATPPGAASEGPGDPGTELWQALRRLAAGESLPGVVKGDASREALDVAVAAWPGRFPEGCERVLVALPGSSAARLVAWLAVLTAGARLCLPAFAEAGDELSLARRIEELEPQLVLLTSPALEALLDMDAVPQAPDYLVWAMPGASQLQDRIREKGLTVHFLVTSDATLGLGLIGDGDDWPLVLDRPDRGVAARVFDSRNRDQLTGLDGRLGLSVGAFPAAALAPAITVRRDAEGRIRWPDVDAVDAPRAAEVATGLRSLDAVCDAHVEVRRSNPAAPSLIAWIQQAPRREATNTDLRRALRDQGVRPPSIIVNLDRIPRDRNGAVMRRELDHPDAIPEQSRFEPPTTEREKAFAAIWKDVLSIDRISVNDTFANLGGSSVQALVILSETQKRLGCSFEPRLLFFQSLRQIAGRFPENTPRAVAE